MKKIKLLIGVMVCGGLLAGVMVQPYGAWASPPKMEFSNTTVLAISGVTIVALVTTAILTHDQYLKNKAKHNKAITTGQKVEYKVKNKEEMKKELEQMRQEDN